MFIAGTEERSGVTGSGADPSSPEHATTVMRRSPTAERCRVEGRIGDMLATSTTAVGAGGRTLPATGRSDGSTVVVASVVLAAGAGLLLVARRRTVVR
jgi:LPXTG-motif cell wall-anchored protein